MPKKHRGISGEIELYYDWEESASSHYEETSKAILKPSADGVGVVLEMSEEEFNVFKRRDTRIERYYISTNKLIELFKTQGSKLK